MRNEKVQYVHEWVNVKERSRKDRNGRDRLNCFLVPLPPLVTPTVRSLMFIYVGQLNIIQSRYTLGISLLEDDNGVLVDALRSEHTAWAIFQRWTSGTGRKPTSWRTLVDVLRQWPVGCTADAIDAYCGR